MSNYTYVHNLPNPNTTVNIGSFSGINDYYMTLLDNEDRDLYGGSYQHASAGSNAGYSQIATYSSYNMIDDSSADAYYYNIQPINSTDVALVRAYRYIGSPQPNAVEYITLPLDVSL